MFKNIPQWISKEVSYIPVAPTYIPEIYKARLHNSITNLMQNNSRSTPMNYFMIYCLLYNNTYIKSCGIYGTSLKIHDTP